VTDYTRDVYRPGDARLLSLVRDGDAEAYEVVCQRHERAARRLARCLVPAEEADDLVVETLDQILDAILDGGGPIGAFRPYLLTAVRRVSSGWQPPQHTHGFADAAQLPDPGELLVEPAVADLAASAIAQAFLSLPDRWMAVLWHIEIEQANPAETGEIVELDTGEVATQCHRAWDGLRQAYVQLQIEYGARSECQPVLRLLPGFVGDTASSPDRAAVSEHLTYCDQCHAVWAELTDIDAATLRTVVAPVFLGSVAEAYLAAGDAPAVPTATAGGAYGPDWEHREPTPGRARHASRQSRLMSRPSLWIAGVTAAAAVVVLALAVTRPPAPPTSAHQRPQAALAPVPDGTQAGTPTRSPQAGATTDPSSAQPGAPAGPAGPWDPVSGATPTPTANPRPSTPTPSPTPTPTPTSSPSPTATPTPTPSPSPTTDP
jgi:DNA-directed RNA polymerase specialized sigma24 family protein